MADDKAWARTRRPKRCKLATDAWLRQAVASKLRLNWAPEQIAGWLKRVHPEDERFYVSHETIYRSLFVQARGVLKKELLYHLRSKRTIRRSKQAGLISDGRGQIKDRDVCNWQILLNGTVHRAHYYRGAQWADIGKKSGSRRRDV